MDFRHNPQNSGHQQSSTTVWTQPSTDEQRRYYSKHAGEKRVFGWITTVFQGAHGAIAFAAWTGIYVWLFQSIPFMLPLAPVLSGVTLVALHVLFRVTWQTYWYDRLDDDPNTDSPVWVPVVIIVALLAAEIQGFQQFLEGQVKPATERPTEQVHKEHDTTVASLEQSYSNEKSAIEATYKEKERAATLPYDRQIRSARNRSVTGEAERKQRNREVASLERQRDQALAPVLAAKAEALETAYKSYSSSKNNALGRRDQAVAHIDASNQAEHTRVATQLDNVGTYSYVLSFALLALIALLSYRTVRINVKSGIIPLRNYTILDAHGSLPERIFTAIADAINRRGLQFAVWMHRLLSPKTAITSFDGTVVAQPGTYNTPEGFHQQQHPTPTDDELLRKKVADKVLGAAARGEVKLTPELLQQEFENARRLNGHYKDTPIGGKHEPSPASARPAEGPTVAPPHQRTAVTAEEYDDLVRTWARRVQAQLDAYDQHVRNGETGPAGEIQKYVMSDPLSPIVKEGNRLHLEWGVRDGEFVVRRRDKAHWVALAEVSERSLEGTTTSEAASEAAEDEELFKQNLNLFKQRLVPHFDDEGNVIGVKYRKKSGEWTTYDYNTVAGQLRIYQRRADRGEVSDAVREGLEKWQYATSLFRGREVANDNLQPVVL